MPGLSFAVSLMLSAVLAAWLGIDGPLLKQEFWADPGFSGAIIGGAIGGGFTVLAGWLAWSGVQAQIAQQRAIVHVTLDENRKRTLVVLNYVREVLELAWGEVYERKLVMSKTIAEGRRSFAGLAGLTPIGQIFAHNEIWRLDDYFVARLRAYDAWIEVQSTDRTSMTAEQLAYEIAHTEKRADALLAECIHYIQRLSKTPVNRAPDHW